MNKIYFADDMDVLPGLPPGSIDLVYIDPPFNTGKLQQRTQIQTVADENGDRTGFQGRRYKTIEIGKKGYIDWFDDFMGFLEPRFEQADRLLKDDGAFFLHIDYREVHYCKVLLDAIFGRECFMNEIIWAYDYGSRSKKKWSTKHDSILWYVKDPTNYTFIFNDMERIPYMAPGLVSKEKAARGKTPTDVWWHTIVPTNGRERTGYPTQKPLGIMKRIIEIHTRPGEVVLDFFAGSGTTGEAAVLLDREFILIDNNMQAMEVMARRFGDLSKVEWVGFDPNTVAGKSKTANENCQTQSI